MNMSTQGELIIAKFIDTLTIREDLNQKTLKAYAGDLKQFVGWFEAPEHQEIDIIFRIEDVSTPTLTRYRDVMQRITAICAHPAKKVKRAYSYPDAALPY